MVRLTLRKPRVDPNAPKKVPQPYSVFFSETREELVKQNPNLKYNEITKKLGEMWRQCDPNTKLRYQKEFQAKQIEYEQKLVVYKATKKNKKPKSKKENNEVSQEYDVQS